MMTGSAHAVDDHVCGLQDYRPLFPFATLKALGRPVYRSQAARDYACLLDIDPEVVSWWSFTDQITNDAGERRRCHHVDFMIQTATERLMVEVSSAVQDATSRSSEVHKWLQNTLATAGYRYQLVRLPDLNPLRLRNARDLIRYARYEASLGDRIRVLAALDELGNLTLAECLTAVREGKAMETMASLILRGHIDVDLDNSLLGPDTIVRRSAT